MISIERIVVTLRNYFWVHREDPQQPGVGVVITILGGSAIVTLLSLGNVFAFKEFWPFLAAQVWLLGVACYAFAQLLLAPGRD